MINKRPHEAENLFDDEERWVAVSVDARVQTNGKLIPLCFELDGRSYPIEKIIEERPARSRKNQLSGTRFIVLVQGQRYLLYHDRACWFLELNQTV